MNYVAQHSSQICLLSSVSQTVHTILQIAMVFSHDLEAPTPRRASETTLRNTDDDPETLNVSIPTPQKFDETDKSSDKYLVTLDESEDPKQLPGYRKWIAVSVISAGAFCATSASSMVRTVCFIKVCLACVVLIWRVKAAFTEPGVGHALHVGHEVTILGVSLFVLGLGTSLRRCVALWLFKVLTSNLLIKRTRAFGNRTVVRDVRTGDGLSSFLSFLLRVHMASGICEQHRYVHIQSQTSILSKNSLQPYSSSSGFWVVPRLQRFSVSPEAASVICSRMIKLPAQWRYIPSLPSSAP